MKKLISFVFILILSVCVFGCDDESSVVRIHIRANSNSERDQAVKLLVRDAVIEYITPLIAMCEDSSGVKTILSDNLVFIEAVADEILLNNGFLYRSDADIRNEYFPSRDYGGEVFPADYYDALILELGSGVGDNWWCVAYPPLCFVGASDDSTKVKYKSKIIELINKYSG